MSEEATTPEVTSYPTAFLMLKSEDGTWSASTDLTKAVKAEHVATRLEVRQGCQEIASVITQQDIAGNVVTLFLQNFSTDNQRETAPTSDDSTGSTPEN